MRRSSAQEALLVIRIVGLEGAEQRSAAKTCKEAEILLYDCLLRECAYIRVACVERRRRWRRTRIWQLIHIQSLQASDDKKRYAHAR